MAAQQIDVSDSNVTIIGKGAKLRGELELEGPSQILGCVQGRISSNAQIHIGQGADCSATVHAPTVIVDGAVNGDLIASEKLQLTANAVVRGDIAAAALIVAEGAAFTGHVAVGPEAVLKAQKKLTSALEAKPQTSQMSELSEHHDWAARVSAA